MKTKMIVFYYVFFLAIFMLLGVYASQWRFNSKSYSKNSFPNANDWRWWR
jgi:hypothetical protein